LGRGFTPFQYHCERGGDGMDEEGEEGGGGEQLPFIDDMQMEGLTDEMRTNLDLLANLTLDDKSDQCIPKRIDSLEGIRIVGASAGHRHSMLLDSNGYIYSCGVGSGGALGHGNGTKQDYPMKIMEFETNNISILQISAGVDISMAVSTEGTVYAWGQTTGGRVGLPNVHDGHVTIPRRVIVGNDNEKAVDVECGYVHSLIVGYSGAIYMCGGVGTDGADDGQMLGEVEEVHLNDVTKIVGQPVRVRGLNIWHKIAEPKEVKKAEKWKKYGKYELKGRRSMMAEKDKWGA